jgi:phage FluMu gp28-like protein
MKAALALLMWGGKVLVISTHLGAENTFNKMIEAIRAGKLPYHVERTTLDDALQDGLYKRICLVLGKDWSPEAEARWRADLIKSYGDDADEELFCIPSKGGGIYMPRTLIEARTLPDLPVLRLERPPEFTFLAKGVRESEIAAWCKEHLEAPLNALDPDRQHAFGQDFARVSDLSDIVPIQIGKTLKRIVPFVVEMRGIPFEQQWQVLQFICDRLPRFIGGKMDATGNGAYLAEVAAQKYGPLRVQQLKLNADWYLENFPPLKQAFEDGSILIPADDDLVGDVALVQKVRGIPRVPEARTTGADGKKRHGDFAIGLVLAYAQTRSGVFEFGYRSEASEGRDFSGPQHDDDDGPDREWWRSPLGSRVRGQI